MNSKLITLEGICINMKNIFDLILPCIPIFHKKLELLFIWNGVGHSKVLL